MIAVFDVIVVGYLALFFGFNFLFVVLAWKRVSRHLQRDTWHPPESDEHNPFMPLLSLLVPAYNEEVTCIESVQSLLSLRYPAYEIIICNDGSKDRTVEVLIEAFDFVRTDINYEGRLGTAEIRGLYRARGKLPANVKRLVLIDKANGGKADALNASINASQGVFVSSMDADSLLEPTALLRAMQTVADDPNEVIAVGVQVGLSNGSLVEDGEVVELRMPKSWIARFQIVEYMRSFGQGRTALGELNALLILSGVFALIRRDLLVECGGFLTKYIDSKIVTEYCGKGAHTVCEDMEVVVRLHRYLLDKGRTGTVAILPHPVAWTEAPEVYTDLGKQRGRWYRGLLEVLQYHRAMFLRKRFGRIGMFSLPYQFLFEAVAPVIETFGYLVVPMALVAGLLSPVHLFGIILLALALNIALTVASVVMCVRWQRAGPGASRALFRYPRPSDNIRLLAAAILSNFGYRQFLVYWQLRGLRDFLKGRKDWDKFARKGFAKQESKP